MSPDAETAYAEQALASLDDERCPTCDEPAPTDAPADVLGIDLRESHSEQAVIATLGWVCPYCETLRRTAVTVDSSDV